MDKISGKKNPPTYKQIQKLIQNQTFIMSYYNFKSPADFDKYLELADKGSASKMNHLAFKYKQLIMRGLGLASPAEFDRFVKDLNRDEALRVIQTVLASNKRSIKQLGSCMESKQESYRQKRIAAI